MTRNVLECDECKGTDVIMDAWASMNEETGAMELEDTLESAFCRDCDHEIGYRYTQKVLP